MSWYYDYYICRKSKDDGKIYPFGPFDYNGKFFPALSKSRSFTSDLHEYFRDICTSNERKQISEELIKKFMRDFLKLIMRSSMREEATIFGVIFLMKNCQKEII